MNTNLVKSLLSASLGLTTIVSFTACETPGQTALLGAGIGAVSGSGHHRARNAAIGAGAGYLAGRVLESERQRAYDQGLADRDGYYYDNARYYRGGRYYDDSDRVVVRQRRYYVAPTYRTERVYVY